MKNEKNNENIIRCKVIIVGDSSVGKTSIIARYLNKYDPKVKATIGATFANKSEIINDKEILFEIWDTAGQERFRSINSIFYQDAYICILVYDITKQASFDNLKDYWHDSVIESSSKDIIFHVVGNKVDLYEEEVVDRAKVDEYGKSIGAGISYISAKDENNCYVDRLFKDLGTKFLNSDIYNNRVIKKNTDKSGKIKLNDESNGDPNQEIKKKKKCC